MQKIPFLVVNPKAYVYGEKTLALALASDKIAKATGIRIYFTCPFTDLRMVSKATKYIKVTA